MRDDIDNVNRFFMPKRMRVSKAKLRRMRRRRRIKRFIAVLVIVIAVISLIVAFIDVGDDMIMTLAKNYAAENMDLNLKAESVNGNPLKGYTMKNVELEDMTGKTIMSAERLSGYINFDSLFKGKIDSLFSSKISIHNALFEFAGIGSRMDASKIEIDLRKFIAEIDAKINGLALKGNIDIGNDPDIMSVNKADLKLGTGKITAIGGLFGNGIYDLHAAAEDLSLEELTVMFPDAISSRDFSGKMNLTLDVTGTKEAPKILGSVDYIGTKIYAFPIERMSANYNYSVRDNMLMINNIQASAISMPIQGEVNVLLGDENIGLRIKLDGSDTNLEGLDEILNVPELKTLGGRIDAFGVNINGNMNSLNGLVNLNAPKISYMGRTISNLKLQMKLSRSNTGIVDGKFSFEDANGFVNGDVESFLSGANMNITAKIAELDIKRVENIIPDYPTYDLEGKIMLSLNVKGEASRPIITGALSSEEFRFKTERVMKPQIDFKIEDETLTIERTAGTLNEKPLAITGTLRPFPSSNPELDLTVGATKITGALNDPVFASQDMRLESQDTDQELESQDTKIESQDIKEDN